jgi:hypothetical protein
VKYLVFLFAFALICCGRKIDLSELVNKNFLYFPKADTLKPFSGTADGKDTSRGTEYVLTSYTFKNGIPNGKWKAYGYQHETIMNGRFTPVLKIEEIKNDFPDLKRINIDRYTEGTDEKMVDLLLISGNPSINSINYKIKKKILLEYLVRKRYLLEEEIPKIYEYVVSEGEF